MSRRLTLASTSVIKKVERKSNKVRVESAIAATNKRPDRVVAEKETLTIYVAKRNRRNKLKVRQYGCRELDFSAYPITGTHISVGVEKMLRDRKFHIAANKSKQADTMIEVSAVPPSQFYFKECEETGVITRYKKDAKVFSAEVKEWSDKIRGNLSRSDMPTELSRNEPKTGDLWIDNPTANPANGKMQKPVFEDARGKSEPEYNLDLQGTLKLKAVIAEAKMKEANSHLREIPLALCIWLISVQENWDEATKKEYKVISDKQADLMTRKLRGEKMKK